MVLYQHLLAAADKYGLERMKLVCQEKLCKHIRADSVAAMLVLADRHHCPGLKEACFHFLISSANLDSFTETDGFEVLNASCPAVLKELLAKLATVLIF
jgi:speckle-type POZ protein